MPPTSYFLVFFFCQTCFYFFGFGNCGFLGPRPRPSTLSQPAQSKSLKGKRPKHQPVQECPVGPSFGRLRIPWPGRNVLLKRLFFPIGNSPKRSYQPTLYFTSISSLMNGLRHLQQNREVLVVVVQLGR